MLVVSLLAFGLAFVGSVPLAGPVSVMVVSRAGTGRFAEARRLAYGASLAEGIYAGLAFWGFATFLARYPVAVPISHGVTALVLFAVGIHFSRWTPPEDGAPEKRPSGHGAFALGFTASILNPTLMLTWGAVTTAIYSHQLVVMTGWLAIPFALAAGAGVAGWNTVLVWLMKRYHEKFPKAVLKWFVRGMGILLIAIAAWSVIKLVHLR